MPAWIDSPKKEKAWKEAKAIVRKQRKRTEDQFKDRDWALVTKIAQNILAASMNASIRELQTDPRIAYALANVEHILEARRKKDRKKKDADLPADVLSLVAALSQVMAFGGQSIAALRNKKKTGLSEKAAAALAAKLESIAADVKALLAGLQG